MSSLRQRNESPVFVKLFDLMAWLTAITEKFRRPQRFILANRLLDTGFACHAQLVRARKVSGGERSAALLEADVLLETLRLQWRLTHELKCVTTQQYAHGAKLIDEVGRLLGAWRKT